MKNVVLGRRYRDIVTGFTGIATSKHEYLNKCLRVSITPPIGKENKLEDAQVFDIQQLEEVDNGIWRAECELTPADIAAARPGGDRSLNAPHR